LNIQNIRKQLGNTIREIRKQTIKQKTPLTAEKAAFHADLSKQGWLNIEQGLKDTRLSTLIKVSKVLNLSVWEILKKADI
jgi:DNA-binding XRE family transcriptional regulator